TTGIAGYTLLYNSYGMQLVAHKKFTSKQDVLLNGTDVLSVKRLVDKELERKKVLETNIGEKLLQEIQILKSLLEYRSEEHTSELQSRENLVCRLLLEKKK